jgi:di/tricarboxylate transporter
MSSAIVGGALAPTSINGITTATVAKEAGIPYNGGLMFFLSVAVNALVVLVAFLMFGGRELIKRSREGGALATQGSSTSGVGAGGGSGSATLVATMPKAEMVALTRQQAIVLASLILLVAGFFTLTVLDVDMNLGVVALAIAMALSLAWPEVGSKAMTKVDWGTILLLGGILTYIGVLTRLGAIDNLGEAARSVSTPIIAAIVICVVGALVSAFASTIGILGALIPLAVPLLLPGGGLETTGLIYALAISASLVDCAPFSTTGATIIAAAAESERPRLTRNMMNWGFAMIIIGPAATIATMVVPFV